MTPTIEILISSPLSGSEAAALRDIVAEVRAPALILANFEISGGGTSHEIDYVVITDKRAELIELKTITAPLKGDVNGAWHIETAPGLFVPYPGLNPWEQARDAKMALSDAMHDYAKRCSEAPKPTKRKYYEQFDASVTVYPMLVPTSRVFGGNYKAWVRSFPDTIEALNARPLPVRTTWEIRDWKTFAVNYLGLRPATLAEAIDAAVFRASQSLEEYTARLHRPDVATLLPAQDQEESIGQNVIDRLKGTKDVLLVGRSGLGKSFHLDHYRRVCFEFNEVPILLHPRYYQGDLGKAIHKSIGPYTAMAPSELLDAAKRLGKRPVLIIDGWNECPPGQTQTDLGNDLAAFQLRYNARFVTASQTSPSHQVFSTVVKTELGPLRYEHKQAILAFHAGIQLEKSKSAHWCEQFSTAFDLAIAGRCLSNSAGVETRAELYESYLRSRIPSVSARSILRKLAWYMGEDFKPVLLLSDYERIAEKFVQELGVSLSIADELLASRLLVIDREVVTFEHELLRDYLRAEHLLMETAFERLAAKLQKPKYTELTEFVIPSITNQSLVREVLVRSEPDLLSMAFRGWLGATAMRLIKDDCQRLLTDCRERLSDITLELSIGEFENSGQFVSSAYVVGTTCASDLDIKLCAVISGNLDDGQVKEAFLDLLDVGEWALKQASERIGRERRIKPGAIWRELLHHNVILSNSGGSVHPLLFICNQLRKRFSIASRHSDGLPIREALLNKTRKGVAGALALLLLLSDSRFSESIDVSDVLTIAREAWNTGLRPLRMETLEFINSNARSISDAGQDAAVIALLDSFDVKNDFLLSTIWVETRSSFAGFEIGVDTESALQEFQSVLAAADAGDDLIYRLEQETDPSITFDQFVGNWASAALGKIFEEVFQGAYYEAYDSLRPDEKKKLLTLALQRQHIGLFTDYYLKELHKLGYEGAEGILALYGGRIYTDSPFPQDCVESFILSHEAWAKSADSPIPYRDASSDDHRVWEIVGELTFWRNRNDARALGRVEFLCKELTRFPKALPDVLERVGHSHKGMGKSPALRALLAQYSQGIRNALHESLTYGGSFTSAFRNPPFNQPELFRWTISTLGDIGDRTSISRIRSWTDSPIYGRSAIDAIERIEQRVAGLGYGG